MRKLLNFQTGSAIILALIAVGSVSSIVIYLMNFSSDSNKKIVDDARIASYKNLVDVARTRLHSGRVCTDILRDKLITSDAFTKKGQSITLPDLKLPMNERPLGPPSSSSSSSVWRLKGGTYIEDVRLVISEMIRSSVFFGHSPASVRPMVAAKGHILIIPGHDGVGAELPRNHHYRIPLFIYYRVVSGSELRIDSCFEPNGEAFICTTSAFGAYEIDESIPENRCFPQRYCKQDGTGIKTGADVCTLPFKKTVIGNNGTSEMYVCEWCNPYQIPDLCYDYTRYKFYQEPSPLLGSNPFANFNSLDDAPNGSGFPVGCGDPILRTSSTGGSSGGGISGYGGTGIVTGGSLGGLNSGTVGGIDLGSVGGVSGGAIGGFSSGVAGGLNDGGCFTAGTEITLIDGSKKNIEEVSLGDKLINTHGQLMKVKKLLSYNYSGPIFSINGGPYFFTPNHPFLSLSGWKSLDPKLSMKEAPDIKVDFLKVGDILVKNNGYEVVLSIDSMLTTEKVYNFSLDNNHEYFANDFAVHNKTPSTL